MTSSSWPANCAGCPTKDGRPPLCVLPTPPSVRPSPLWTTTFSATSTSPASSASNRSPADYPNKPVTPPRRRLSECVFDSDEMDRLSARGLIVDDREQMNDFMSFATEAADCEMAAEVVDLLIPRNRGSAASQRRAESDRRLLQRYILYWTSLTPHSLCVLISTVILLERLKALHPGLAATGRLKDTTLRVVFSAYLIAMKFCTEASYLNQAFERRTPWSLEEMNAMERELLIHLSWTIYISSEELLQRAQIFWQRHELTAARRWKDDGAPDFQTLLGPNLFCVASST